MSDEMTPSLALLVEMGCRQMEEVKAVRAETGTFRAEMGGFRAEMDGFRDQMNAFREEMASFRDDMTVLTGMTMRLDGSLTCLLVEVRGMHSRQTRLENRIKRLEEASLT
jgi:hypothetical protein